ncbi:hypothetical protein [Bacillus spizizenii]|uniref:hypothetical protein n=1 Tax=Bacillus spizizenii TaxID=96241 RepID=UPI00398A83D5
MNKLQEIKARISKPTDQYWMDKEHIDFLIDRTELSVKQQEIIEENKRQQEVTVHQFRQAQEEIQRLNGELKQAHEKSGNLLGEWRRAETQTAKISDQLMDMKVMLRMEQGKVQWQKAKNGQLKEALTFMRMRQITQKNLKTAHQLSTLTEDRSQEKHWRVMRNDPFTS